MRHLKIFFDKTIEIIFGVIIALIIVAIGFGVMQLLKSVYLLFFTDNVAEQYIKFIAEILTLYILVELCRSLVEYFDSHRIRLSNIIDAAIVFIIREILIMLFKHDIKPDVIYALTALLFVLGALRYSSIHLNFKERIGLKSKDN